MFCTACITSCQYDRMAGQLQSIWKHLYTGCETDVSQVLVLGQGPVSVSHLDSFVSWRHLSGSKTHQDTH